MLKSVSKGKMTTGCDVARRLLCNISFSVSSLQTKPRSTTRRDQPYLVHQEGEQTITVTFDSFETVDGIRFEKEIHRSAGDPSRGAVIRFTRTVINQPVDAGLFSIRP